MDVAVTKVTVQVVASELDAVLRRSSTPSDWNQTGPGRLSLEVEEGHPASPAEGGVGEPPRCHQDHEK